MKNEKSPKRINQNRLVKMFKDIKRLNSTESRFCFLIGAGASRSSNIKTGKELSIEWYRDLKEDLDKNELLKWENEISFKENRIGEFYPYLYKKRYEASPQLGYDEFKKMMESIDPGLGYVILSQILADGRHNFVITTNFDYLIEDAVRMYTSTKPFSAGHETLAEYISSQTEKPTIIKVHRDLLLHPFNNESETEKLKDEWAKALTPILKNFNLLVIGYGGNDGSLMDYLNNINPSDRKPIYWCVRNSNEINSKIKKLLTEKDFIITISGFDELMFALNDALDYKVFDNLDDSTNHPFVLAAKETISNLSNKRKNLLEKLQKEKKPVPKGTKELFKGSFRVLLNAAFEKNIDKKDKIYQEGLELYPSNANLMSAYAVFLSDVRKDYEKAEKYYKMAIEFNPNNSVYIGNYANFLNVIKKEHNEAEQYYKKAIELDPKDANNLGNYAIFLKNIRKQYDEAEAYFVDAITLNPKSATKIGNYAIFLSDIRKDFDKAEEYYKKAIELDLDNSDYIFNYARFLSSIRKNYDKAEEYYKKAIKLKPNDPLLLGGYILFLKNIRKDYYRTEEYYKKIIKLEQNEPNIIGCYATFLSDIRKDYTKAEEYYKKAIDLDPENANNIGNYAHHLIISKQDFENAEKYINNSFKLAKDDDYALLAELWFYRYAHYNRWYQKGEKKLTELISMGAKSTAWNFQAHIDIAKKNNTSNIQKLEKFAKLITE